jgi:hypothetical protein
MHGKTRPAIRQIEAQRAAAVISALRNGAGGMTYSMTELAENLDRGGKTLHGWVPERLFAWSRGGADVQDHADEPSTGLSKLYNLRRQVNMEQSLRKDSLHGPQRILAVPAHL